MPQAFERALLVPRQPPFAKTDLNEQKRGSDKQARHVVAPGSQVQPERKINQGAGTGLRDIIGKAHFSVITKGGSEFPSVRPVCRLSAI